MFHLSRDTNQNTHVDFWVNSHNTACFVNKFSSDGFGHGK